MISRYGGHFGRFCLRIKWEKRVRGIFSRPSVIVSVFTQKEKVKNLGTHCLFYLLHFTGLYRQENIQCLTMEYHYYINYYTYNLFQQFHP